MLQCLPVVCGFCEQSLDVTLFELRKLNSVLLSMPISAVLPIAPLQPANHRVSPVPELLLPVSQHSKALIAQARQVAAAVLQTQ